MALNRIFLVGFLCFFEVCCAAQNGVLRLARSCLEVQGASANASDGHYTLDIHGQPGVIYCHRMNTSTPQEYISLHYTNRFGLHRTGIKRTYFQKVAVNLTSTEFITNDWTFSYTEFKPQGQNTWYNGSTESPKAYGAAGSCRGGTTFIEYGHGDLRKTGFGFNNSMDWTVWGYLKSIEEITKDWMNNETFHVKCGGYCGGCGVYNFYFQVQPARAGVTGKRVFVGDVTAVGQLLDDDLATFEDFPNFFSLNFKAMAQRITVHLVVVECPVKSTDRLPLKIGVNPLLVQANKSATFQMDMCSVSTVVSGNFCQLIVECATLTYSDAMTAFVAFPTGGTLKVHEITFDTMP